MTPPILDTHQHLILDRWPYSWTDDIPALKGKTFGPDAYAAASAGTGITHTVFMETSPDDPHWREEITTVYAMAEDPASPITGVITNCRPEHEGFESFLEETAHPRRVGLRRILHTAPDDLSRSERFRENVRLAGRRGLTFDMCFFERQLPIALELARACPDVRLILDHCGVPDIRSGKMDPWHGYIRDLAALPNVHCKVSGVLAYCDPAHAGIEAVRPYVEHVIECFGWERVVWGSDWPVVTITSTLRDWVEVSRAIVAGEDPANQRKLFFDNAVRIYGVKL